jgi:hypothetical protein
MSRARDIADGKFSGAVVAASADFTGTVEAADLSDGTTTVGTEYVTNGSAKAWVNFNGTGTIAARDSFNVSSLTDNGTGDYTINFSNAFDVGDYAVSGVAQAASASNDAAQAFPLLTVEGTASPTAGASRIFMRSARNAYGLFDYNNVSPVFHGDLA